MVCGTPSDTQHAPSPLPINPWIRLHLTSIQSQLLLSYVGSRGGRRDRTLYADSPPPSPPPLPAGLHCKIPP